MSVNPSEEQQNNFDTAANSDEDNKTQYYVWLLAGLLVGVFVINLFVPRDLWVQDEARYGEVMREMLHADSWKDWLVPHLNGYPYPDKPPLYFWALAVTGSVFGQNEFAYRLFTVITTAVSAAGVFLLARQLIGLRLAFWAAAIFSTILLTMLVGQIIRMDMLLCASAIFAWYGLLRYQKNPSPGYTVLFWTMALLGVAVKGPIALLFSLLPAIVWQYWERRWEGIRQLRLLPGITSLMVMAGMWMGAVVLSGNGAYLLNIWNKQLVGRSIKSWSHAEPVYFYAMLLPLVLLPWTSLVVKGFYGLAKRQPVHWRSVFVFSLIPLLALSMVSGKLFIYMQPLMPPLCIAAAFAVGQLSPKRLPLWVSIPPVLYVLLLASILIWSTGEFLAHMKSGAYVTSGLFILLTAVGLVLIRQQRDRWLAGWLVNSVIASWLLFGAVAYMVNPLYSAKNLGEAVAAQAGGRTVGLVDTTRGILNYYADMEMTELKHGEALNWWRQNPDAMLIIKTKHLDKVFTESMPSDCRYHQTFSVELKEYHVYKHCRLDPPQ
jgi:4-amino-4-deoxy-L-arabinose transferase-like glycosyltransferase